MSPIITETIREKILKLHKAVNKLKKMQSVSKQDFIADGISSDVVSYNFIIAIEAVCDIGNFILGEKYSKSTDTYRDIIKMLGEVGVVDKDFAAQNEMMADFRNKLVHDYSSTNSELVYEYLQKSDAIFNVFIKAFEREIGI